jgi:mRNA interferase MazF
MGTFAVGDVAVVPFPYADFSMFKKRPALVVGQAEFDSLILCQITSKADTSKHAILLRDTDFRQGTLHLDSYIRFDKIFTVEQSILERNIGSITPAKLQEVHRSIQGLFVPSLDLSHHPLCKL